MPLTVGIYVVGLEGIHYHKNVIPYFLSNQRTILFRRFDN